MKKKIHDLDSVLSEIGQFGGFQILTCAFLCIPIFLAAFRSLSYIFTASSVEHRCHINECDLDNNTHYAFLPSWLNNSIPYENGIPAKCSRYKSRGFTSDFENDTSHVCMDDLFDQSTIESCDEFVFKDDRKTIATEFNLLCSHNGWKLALVGTLNSFGQLIGVPLGGYISDRYGRRTTLALAGTLSALMGIIRSFSVDYIMFAIFESLDAAVGIVLFPTCMVLAMEMVGPEKRVLASIILTLFIPLGNASMGVVAIYVTDWRSLLRILTIPGLVHIFYFWFINESVRWLLVQSRYEEATTALNRAAKLNKTNLSEASLKDLYADNELVKTTSKQSSCESYPIRDIFKSPKLLWRIANCCFCFITNTLVYYGLSLNSVTLAGDKHMNFIFACLVELPGFLISYIVMSKLGRRPSQSGSLIISGVACFLSCFATQRQPWLAFLLFLMGKFAIGVSFTVLYIYVSELFPTNLRQSLLSFCSMFGRIGSMVAPQTPLIAQYVPSLPLILFGTFAVTSGLLVLRFPETLDTKLPTTIVDAENVGEKKLEKPDGANS